MYGNATWNHTTFNNGSYIPFVYQVHLPGVDKQGRNFLIDLKIDPMKYPSPYGGNILNGRFTFYDQPNTLSWFETGLELNGTVTWGDITEPVVGNTGHIDRQYFPLYAGIFSPTGRQVSHIWYQVNLANGVDLSIWIQYRRYEANKIVPTIGITTYEPNGNPINQFVTDINITFLSFIKYPNTSSTFFPPPSQNRWLPGITVIQCPSLNMILTSTYSTKVPAVDLPVEYFEGPSYFAGTFRGESIDGTGIQESTLALYRDWELLNVLQISAQNLSPESFNPAGPNAEQLVQVINVLNNYVNPNPLLEKSFSSSVICM
ncbi:unnamed protein product [Adineta steineri]|uniref:Uncharacterized protein n=1 Tax=Adineta steineri TaxID=433720 RepID=A0A820A4F9_9BILA|nr:unnamed protein product [Adineta steineri]CAF4183776.1 unnamed protein product [Adineta steineri]